jgi:hypothetical protein
MNISSYSASFYLVMTYDINKTIIQLPFHKGKPEMSEQDLDSLTMRIEQLEKQSGIDYSELDKRVEYLESQIYSLRYLMGRNQELEYLESPYSLDGDPRCNF